jgi:hypothetical protein
MTQDTPGRRTSVGGVPSRPPAGRAGSSSASAAPRIALKSTSRASSANLPANGRRLAVVVQVAVAQPTKLGGFRRGLPQTPPAASTARITTGRARRPGRSYGASWRQFWFHERTAFDRLRKPATLPLPDGHNQPRHPACVSLRKKSESRPARRHAPPIRHERNRRASAVAGPPVLRHAGGQIVPVVWPDRRVDQAPAVSLVARGGGVRSCYRGPVRWRSRMDGLANRGLLPTFPC